MNTWHVYTDGSAITEGVWPPGKRTPRRRYPGGWAAVVERGSDGYVLRGREADTTNVRMELRAVIEGLKAVAGGDRVVLHFDCTVVYTVRDRWQRGLLGNDSADRDLWLELAAQFERVTVVLRQVRPPDPVHRRAHSIARAEAKALAAGLPAHAMILSKVEKKERHRAVLLREQQADDKRRRRQVSGFVRVNDAFVAGGLRHLPDCEPTACLVSCPIWLNFGVRASKPPQ